MPTPAGSVPSSVHGYPPPRIVTREITAQVLSDWQLEAAAGRNIQLEQEAEDMTTRPEQNAELRQKGRVSRHVYWVYLLAAGPLLTLVVIASLLLMQASRNGTDLFIAYWSANADSHSQLHFLGALICLAIANSFLTLIRAFSFANGGMNAAKSLHEKLLTTVVYAPCAFFDVNPRGRVINR